MGTQPFESRDFEPSELDSLNDVFGLSPNDPLDTFAEMWYQVFLWSLFSSLFIHLIASSIAFTSLRKHKFARFAPIFIIVGSILTNLTVSLITSAVISGIYRAGGFEMFPLYALMYGLGQTILTLSLAYMKILATL